MLGIDTHVVMINSPSGQVPTPTPMPFSAEISGGLSSTVFIDNKPAAVKGSRGVNDPAHEAVGGSFQTEPSNKMEVQKGSSTVFFDKKEAAREGDPVLTCNDPEDAPRAVVQAQGTVLIGG